MIKTDKEQIFWSEKQKQWLIENHKMHFSYQEISEEFNNVFGTEKSEEAVRQMMNKKLKIKLITKRCSEMFSKDEEKWIVENYERYETYRELTEEFNKIFHNDKTVENIREKCTKRLKLSGMKNPASFKKGNEKEQCPIGTLRKSSNGTTYIKVKDSKFSYQTGYREPYWLPIQKKIYEEHYGKVPVGSFVIFLDGNHENLEIENLYCIDRKISAVMAKNRWFTNSREHTLTAIKWCELYYAMNESGG